ncbi:hypothetical protein E9840_10795 [Tissierella creatinini]|nr:hypothetical protein E9840_10795 [Tissierella creatinini]TJX63830.1 hypothetical protein E8P77_14055 [Soehngenia saccharolytica]
MKDKVVIIGASITGIYAMSELVKNKFNGDITIIDKKDVFPYNTYPLSKEWMMDMDNMEPPLLKDKDFYKKNNINLKLNTKVDFINYKEQTITTNLNETIPYDYLVIATGSKVRKVKISGDDAKGIYYLREFNDAKRIKEWAKNIENIVIIGAGFIGLELASTFTQLDKKVSVLIRSGKPLENILGEQVSEYFTKMHQSHNVNFVFDEETDEFIKDDKGNISHIRTKSGKSIKADMVIIAVGVEPNISFKVDSLDIDHGIIVNKYGETSLPNIYAGGDIVKWPYKNRLIHIEHWENAWGQGISIAKNILNKKSNEYSMEPYFWTDQYDESFEYLGYARTWDKTFVRGSLNEKKFAVAYVDNNNYPLAILFANKFEKRKDMEKLLANNQPLDEAEFTDVNISIDEMTSTS